MEKLRVIFSHAILGRGETSMKPPTAGFIEFLHIMSRLDWVNIGGLHGKGGRRWGKTLNHHSPKTEMTGVWRPLRPRRMGQFDIEPMGFGRGVGFLTHENFEVWAASRASKSVDLKIFRSYVRSKTAAFPSPRRSDTDGLVFQNLRVSFAGVRGVQSRPRER